ncbi:MAG: STAS domain-containing protein [Planctomycetes bacterium]|nr:STAS domain-containing protein [Planctomycetota bacterium]
MLECEETQDGDVTVVSLYGTLDMHQGDEFKERIRRLVAQGHLRLVFDLSALDYICSAGIAALITWTQRIRERRGWLYVCCPQGQVKETFRILRLDGPSPVLRIFASRADAIKELKEP